MIIEKINAFAQNMPENKAPLWELRMSSSGDCVRLMAYEAMSGKKPIEPRHFFRMELGSAIHLMMQDFITKALGDDFHSCEVEISFNLTRDDGKIFTVIGHPDGRISSLKATLEIKTVSDSTFQMVKKQGMPLPAHIEQSNSYAIALGDPSILVLYVNRDTGEMEEFLFESDSEMHTKTKEKFLRGLNSLLTGSLPERPYHDATESPCWFCPYKSECYEGFDMEIKSFGETEIIDNEFNSWTSGAIAQRDSRLSAEKLESSFKKMLGDFLIKQKLKIGRAQDGVVSITTGKNNNLLVSVKPLKKETP